MQPVEAIVVSETMSFPLAYQSFQVGDFDLVA